MSTTTNMPYRKAFSRNLRAARERKGLTQEGLAILAHLHVSALAHYEAGSRIPGIENAAALADALGVPLGSLAGCETTSDFDAGYRRGAFDTREAMKVATRSMCLSEQPAKAEQEA